MLLSCRGQPPFFFFIRMIRKIELQLPNRHDILLKKQNACLGLSFFLREPEFAGIPKSLSAPGSRYSYSCGPRAERKDSVSIAIALEHLAEVFLPDGFFNRLLPLLSAIDTREQEAAKERVRLWEIHSRYYVTDHRTVPSARRSKEERSDLEGTGFQQMGVAL